MEPSAIGAPVPEGDPVVGGGLEGPARPQTILARRARVPDVADVLDAGDVSPMSNRAAALTSVRSGISVRGLSNTAPFWSDTYETSTRGVTSSPLASSKSYDAPTFTLTSGAKGAVPPVRFTRVGGIVGGTVGSTTSGKSPSSLSRKAVVRSMRQLPSRACIESSTPTLGGVDGRLDLVESEGGDEAVEGKASLRVQVHESGDELVWHAVALDDAPHPPSEQDAVHVERDLGPEARHTHESAHTGQSQTVDGLADDLREPGALERVVSAPGSERPYLLDRITGARVDHVRCADLERQVASRGDRIDRDDARAAAQVRRHHSA